MFDLKLAFKRIVLTGLISLIMLSMLGGHKKDDEIMVLLEVECLSDSNIGILPKDEVETGIKNKCRDIPRIVVLTPIELKNLSGQNNPKRIIPSYRILIDYSFFGKEIVSNIRVLDCISGITIRGQTYKDKVTFRPEAIEHIDRLADAAEEYLLELVETANRE
jgi:hypothetical protein